MLNVLSGYVLFPALEKAAKRVITPKVQELHAFAQLSNQEQLLAQKKHLHEMLVYCQKNVPYYQDLFALHQFSPDKVLTDIKYLETLPILTKELIREHSARIKSPQAHHQRKTGGSTGQSAFFYYDNSGLDWAAAINIVSLEMAGKMPYNSECHISADADLLGNAPTTRKGQFMDWISLRSRNRTRLMISRFDENSLSEYYQTLKKRRPYILQGHPSTAYAVAEHIKRAEYKPTKICSVFEPTGEMITDKMVSSIEKHLGCKVVCRYGNAEFGVMAHSRPQDPWNKAQVFRRAFYIEEGQESELTVTGYTNFGFPLIRYQTGDRATVKEESDGCFIYDIIGRVHDSVTINGTAWPTHFIMDTLDHKIRGIREFQIIVDASPDPTLKIVPENPTDQDRILNGVRSIWPTNLQVKFIEFHELERVGWRQKFRHVIDKTKVGPSANQEIKDHRI